MNVRTRKCRHTLRERRLSNRLAGWYRKYQCTCGEHGMKTLSWWDSFTAGEIEKMMEEL